jgi:hypothetical protein
MEKLYTWNGGRIDVLNGPQMSGPGDVTMDEAIADDLMAQGFPLVLAESASKPKKAKGE